MTTPVLHIVHCIDTEGPLDEDLSSTFHRINELFDIQFEPSEKTLVQLQNKEINLDGIEDQVAAVVSSQLLTYNRTWADVRNMLAEALSPAFRNQMLDDFGQGWVYSWHCVDHLGFSENPRHKDLGYGNIFRFYRDILSRTGSHRDEINWHFHPLSLTRNPLSAATSYSNSMDILLYVMCRRIIDDEWFPTTSRPGFHSERPDAHSFMEHWIPFDYANQAIKADSCSQKDTILGRFGDWTRSPQSWLGYHPHHDDYQLAGTCRRWIFRCLNVGTRLRLLTAEHVEEAFIEARQNGSAILAFADHDFRDLRPDVQHVRKLLGEKRELFPDVKICFSGAEEAAQKHVSIYEKKIASMPPKFEIGIVEDRLSVRLVSGALFGPQPFLALKTRDGHYYHDNLDVIEAGRLWTYVLDGQTMLVSSLESIGVGGSGLLGGFDVAILRF